VTFAPAANPGGALGPPDIINAVQLAPTVVDADRL